MSQKSLKEIIADEYKKCATDPVHFMKKYCIIQHPTKGKIYFHLKKSFVSYCVVISWSIFNSSPTLIYTWPRVITRSSVGSPVSQILSASSSTIFMG